MPEPANFTYTNPMLLNNTCLIISDDQDLSFRITHILKKSTDYKIVYTSKNGAAAIKFLGDYKLNARRLAPKYPPAKIIFSCDMQDMKLDEFMQIYQSYEEEEFKKAAIIFITNDEIETANYESLSCFRGFLPGMFTDTELISMVMTTKKPA